MASWRTRANDSVFLIGKTKSEISENQLPTGRDILAYIYSLKGKEHDRPNSSILYCKINNSHELICPSDCDCVLQKIVKIYTKASIPIHRIDRVLERLNNLLDEYKFLLKNKKRNSRSENEKRQIFTEKINTLFECMPIDVELLIERDRKKKPEDRAEDILFLRDQRGERKLGIGGVDLNYRKSVKRQKRLHERLAESHNLKSNVVHVMLSETDSSEVEMITNSPSTSSTSDSEIDAIYKADPSKDVVTDTVLLSKAKNVSVRTQSEILQQVNNLLIKLGSV